MSSNAGTVMPDNVIDRATLEALAKLAWGARENAFIFGDTKVGCAVLSDLGKTFVGCNVEHKYRSHDVHAEVNAIATMIAMGGQRLVAVVVAADRERFTPCGACMDWIMQFGGPDCLVAFSSRDPEPIATYRAHDLMPFYPR